MWDSYIFSVWRVRPLSGAKAELLGMWSDEHLAKRIAQAYRSEGDLSYVLVEVG